MTSWMDDVAHQMFMTIWKNKDNWPAPTACSDAELQAWWDESMERYQLYSRIIMRETERRAAASDAATDKDEWAWSTNPDEGASTSVCFTDKEMERLYERVTEMETELDAIDYEWKRRPWLNKQAGTN